jgi:hypothetical protein
LNPFLVSCSLCQRLFLRRGPAAQLRSGCCLDHRRLRRIVQLIERGLVAGVQACRVRMATSKHRTLAVVRFRPPVSFRCNHVPSFLKWSRNLASPYPHSRNWITFQTGKTSMKLIWLIGAFALFTSPLSAQERKDVIVRDARVTELLSTTMTSSGQPIVVPRKDVQIVVSIYDVMPGVTLQVHNHPYPRYGYVLSGNLRGCRPECGWDSCGAISSNVTLSDHAARSIC